MKECTYSMRKSCKIWSACSEAYGGGEDLPPCTKESQTTDTQRLKAEISFLVTWEGAHRGSMSDLRRLGYILDSLRKLSAV